VQDYIEEGAVDLQSAFRATGIIDKTQLPEPVHEEAHPRTGGAYHFR